MDSRTQTVAQILVGAFLYGVYELFGFETGMVLIGITAVLALGEIAYE